MHFSRENKYSCKAKIDFSSRVHIYCSLRVHYIIVIPFSSIRRETIDECLGIKLAIRKHTEQVLNHHSISSFSADPAGKNI